MGRAVVIWQFIGRGSRKVGRHTEAAGEEIREKQPDRGREKLGNRGCGQRRTGGKKLAKGGKTRKDGHQGTERKGIVEKNGNIKRV